MLTSVEKRPACSCGSSRCVGEREQALDPLTPRGRTRCTSCISVGPISPTGARLLVSGEGFCSASAPLCSCSVFLFSPHLTAVPPRSSCSPDARLFLKLSISFRACSLPATHPPPAGLLFASEGEIRARREGANKGRRRLEDGWRGGGGFFIHFYDHIDKVSSVPWLLGNAATPSWIELRSRGVRSSSVDGPVWAASGR